jgi:CheY-like chemotaxis protein
MSGHRCSQGREDENSRKWKSWCVGALTLACDQTILKQFRRSVWNRNCRFRLRSDREAMSDKIALVVDDDVSVRDFIIAVLQSDGFQTIEAENGVQAHELLHKHGAAVDLVVSDIRMPKMDGITLAFWVRAEFPAIPLILISGYAEIEQAKHPNTGFEFVQLPLHPTTLLSAVKNVMMSKGPAPSE